MDADDVQSATPLRATRVHARMVYANGSTKNSVASSISQRFPPTEITYNPAQSPRKSPHITVGKLYSSICRTQNCQILMPHAK